MEGQARVSSRPRGGLAPESLAPESLRRMHRRCVDDPAEIRALLNLLRDRWIELTSGINRQSTPRTARVLRVLQDRLLLEAKHIDHGRQPQIYLRFEIDHVRYFFAAVPLAGGGAQPLGKRGGVSAGQVPCRWAQRLLGSRAVRCEIGVQTTP